MKHTWYTVIHDIIPTKERLHKIRLAQTPLCPQCNIPDTLQHRITECGEGKEQWIWTKCRIASLLRVEPHCVREEWLYRPQLKITPKQRHQATMWILACFVTIRTQRPQR
jgi:hypothetical protein